MMSTKNPFDHILTDLPNFGKYYSLPALNDKRLECLPYCIRILLESALRCCDGYQVTTSDVENILNWKITSKQCTEIPFNPSRVLLQDFTGVPAAVDLAAMRDAMNQLKGDVDLINPLVPVDLVIDHSVQVDKSRSKDALQQNEDIEFERNHERFGFLKWAASAFSNMLIVPPGSGIVHQVNLEYLARIVFKSNDGIMYPDSVVGTDSHTTMIDGLGVTAWGVGGIEAEAVMLGQPISMVLPEVVGFELIGMLSKGVTATDLVLTITRILRERGVVGKFVEFFGDGCRHLTVADRATISNMSPEYGATMGYFPIDTQALTYLKQTGRPESTLKMVEAYFKAQNLFRLYDEKDKKIEYTGACLRLDLSKLEPCVAGPKRPHDQVLLKNLKNDFQQCLTAPIGFKGYGLTLKKATLTVQFKYENQLYDFKNGSVVIAAITSCTNTSNPSVMLGAGLIAKKAVELGLTVRPYIKTSLSPGSTTVLSYLELSGLLPYLEKLNFYTTGFGCQTCIGNSGQLDDQVAETIVKNDFVATAVLSGNRNFEGRIHPLTRANYLMSPMLVIVFALAGTVDIDLYSDPIAYTPSKEPVYLQDLWPDPETIKKTVETSVLPSMFKKAYTNIKCGGTDNWKQLEIKKTKLYPWDPKSTYIHNPPFFKDMKPDPQPLKDIDKAYCLLYLGDSVTTDHISPAGSIAENSPAALYLKSHGFKPSEYNSYGSRRGNDEVMVRGTFANIRLINKLSSKPGPYTKHIPSGEELSVFDAAMQYKHDGHDLVIITGKEYGSGSSRDWAAKGPYLLGVKAIIAESYERIHRSNLVGMGILPLQLKAGDTLDKLQLKGDERYSIKLADLTTPSQKMPVIIHYINGQTKTIETISRIDTFVELQYFYNGGILPYVLRKLLKKK